MPPSSPMACVREAALVAVLLGGGLGLTAASGGEKGHDATAGLGLAERLDAHLRLREAALRSDSLEHYALLHEVEPADVARWTAPVSFRRGEYGFALGVGPVVELHGGAILGFLFEHWRPGSRAATPDDRYPFLPNGQRLALGSLYEGHRRQVLLPVPGRSDAEIDGALPEPPQLVRMHFHLPGDEAPVERDAYSLLRLLVAREGDFTATWRNHVGQRLSVDLLLRQAWEQYRAERSVEAERADHSRLHLVEILLAYHRRGAALGGAATRLDPNELKARFLATELERTPAAVDDEGLAHYAESLGWLVSHPTVRWEVAERAKVRRWLRWLEEERFTDLGRIEAAYLAHLLRGLRMLEEQRDRWTESTDPPGP